MGIQGDPTLLLGCSSECRKVAGKGEHELGAFFADSFKMQPHKVLQQCRRGYVNSRAGTAQ